MAKMFKNSADVIPKGKLLASTLEGEKSTLYNFYTKLVIMYYKVDKSRQIALERFSVSFLS